MGRLTAQQILDQSLDLVGNPRIQAIGLSWLQTILSDLAKEYRFPELEKQYSVAVSTDTVAYPSDYAFLVSDAKSRNCGRYFADGEYSPIKLGSLGTTRDDNGHTAETAGIPRLIADDRANSQWILHPIPDPAGILYVNYQSNPAAVALTGYPWFPNDGALIEAIAFVAERRQRGGLLQVAAALREQKKKLALSSPSRLQTWIGGPGSGLGAEFK